MRPVHGKTLEQTTWAQRLPSSVTGSLGLPSLRVRERKEKQTYVKKLVDFSQSIFASK